MKIKENKIRELLKCVMTNFTSNGFCNNGSPMNIFEDTSILENNSGVI